MYAVIKTGGKQYRVKAGDLLVVEKLEGEPGAEVRFGEVLMLGDGGNITLGVPTVAKAMVTGTLIETRKGEKIKIFKKIRRQGYRRTKGHRQIESVVRVTSLGIDGGKIEKWEGKVDLTTKAELNARARNLKITVTPLPKAAPAPAAAPAKAKAAPAPAKAKAAPAPAKAEVAPAAEAPKKAAAPKAEAKAPPKKAAAPKAEAAPKAKAAAPKAKVAPAEAKAAAPKAKAKAEPKADAEPKKAAPKKAAAPKKDKGKG